jgi:hypothetical protein
VVPHIAWSVHGTVVSLKDVAVSVSRPVVSALVAALVSAGVAFGLLQSVPSWLRLAVGVGVLVAIYVPILLFAMGQRALFLDVLRGLRAPEPN